MSKFCIQCGAEAPDDQVECTECGRAFSFVSDGGTQGASQHEGQSSSARPDGSGLKTFGGLFFALALLAFLVGWFLPNAQYSFQEIDPERIALKGNLMLFGSSGLQIGAMLWLGGAIIEAISFLPGKDNK